MEVKDVVQVGAAEERVFRVEERFTATHIGSGSLAVLATPSMIGFMEWVACDLLARRLPEGLSSVGILVEVRHLAPTPMGKEVRVRSEVTEVDGRRVTFTVQAWDAVELVGEGRHQRAVVEVSRFLHRVKSKEAA